MAKAERRRFTAEYKLKVLREADHCEQPGEIGALLRREGLYWSNLITWRKQRERGELAGLSAKKARAEAAGEKPLDREGKRIGAGDLRGLSGGRSGPRGSWSCKKKSRRSWGSNWERAPRRTDGDGREERALYSVQSICAGLGIGRASYYRWQRRGPVVTERCHPRALSVNERQDVLGVVNSERFWDQAPGEFMLRY